SLGVLLLIGRPNLDATSDFGLFRCTMDFFLGAASYLVFTRTNMLHSRAVRAVAPYIAAAVVAGGALYLEFKGIGWNDFAFPPLAAMLVTALAASPGSAIDRWLQLRPLAYLGRISYSIYMVHFAVAWLFAG